MPTNNSEYGKAYMKEYIKQSPIVQCSCGGEFKSYNRHHHNKSKRHLKYLYEKNDVEKKNIIVRNDLVEKLSQTELKLLEAEKKIQELQSKQN